MSAQWFDIDVHMRRVSDGMLRVLRDKELMPDDGPWSPFNWEENNYSCDCNRGLFFARAAGEPDPNHPCGPIHDGPLYTVRIVRVSDGEVIYDEQ